MFVYNRAELYKERHRLFVLTGHCQSTSHVVVKAYHLTSYAALSSGIHICYLPAGRSIKVKNCDRVLENAAQSLGQHFQARGQFFTIQDQPHAGK